MQSLILCLLLSTGSSPCEEPIEAHIKGTFDGWNGDTIYKLDDGSVWEQSRYHFHYHYAYHPAVTIYSKAGACHMTVEGDSDEGADVRRLSTGRSSPRKISRAAGSFLIPPGRDPRLSPQINPKFNSSINPNFNAGINPKFSAQLNPTFNAAINPVFSAGLNPLFNATINPSVNASINPQMNGSLNPSAGVWSGFYLFDIDADFTGMAVQGRDDGSFFLLFNSTGSWTGFLAGNGAGGFNRFSVTGEWKGYALPNGAGALNIFDKDGTWRGFSS
jgi:hypothetical protein